jgi:hypothetical protein
VSTEKRLLVVPQYTWKIEYHSHEYWAINPKKTLVSISLYSTPFFLHLFLVVQLNSALISGHNLSFHFNFFNWNRVKLRYCDGASFSGDSENKVSEIVDNKQVSLKFLLKDW